MDSIRTGIRRLLLAAVFCTASLLSAQTDKMEAPTLKAMLAEMGFSVTNLSENKFTFVQQSTSLNIPIAAEISPSGNFVWLTVNLGPSRPTLNFEELLKQNGKIQPNFFYITSKNNLMMAMAMENRALNPTVVRRVVEKIIQDVQGTQPVWGTP